MGYIILFAVGAVSGFFSTRPGVMRTVILGISLILFVGLLAIVIPMGTVTYPIALTAMFGFLGGNLLQVFTGW